MYLVDGVGWGVVFIVGVSDVYVVIFVIWIYCYIFLVVVGCYGNIYCRYDFFCCGVNGVYVRFVGVIIVSVYDVFEFLVCC